MAWTVEAPSVGLASGASNAAFRLSELLSKSLKLPEVVREVPVVEAGPITVTREAHAFASRIHKCSNCFIFVAICAYSLLHYMHI